MTQFKYIPCLICSTLNRVSAEKLSEQAKCGKCKLGLDTKSQVFDVNYNTLEKTISNSPVPVVIDFWAPWCGPCQGFAPVFKQYAQNNPYSAIYLKFNTDNEQELSAKFNIRGIPALLVFEKGAEKARQSGALSLAMLEQWLKKFGV